MLHKAKFVFLLATALFSGTCLAATYNLRPNMDYTIDIEPHQISTFKNPIWTAISAVCVIQADFTSPLTLNVKMLQGTGSVDGRELEENTSYVINLQKPTLSLRADPYAEVELTNNSNQHIHGDCSAEVN